MPDTTRGATTRKQLTMTEPSTTQRNEPTPEKILMDWMDENGVELNGATPAMLVSVLRAAGYAKVDHIEYAAAHKHAGLDVTDEDGELFTDLDGIKWVYEGYTNATLMQRTVGPWVPLEPEAEATK